MKISFNSSLKVGFSSPSFLRLGLLVIFLVVLIGVTRVPLLMFLGSVSSRPEIALVCSFPETSFFKLTLSEVSFLEVGRGETSLLELVFPKIVGLSSSLLDS